VLAPTGETAVHIVMTAAGGEMTAGVGMTEIEIETAIGTETGMAVPAEMAAMVGIAATGVALQAPVDAAAATTVGAVQVIATGHHLQGRGTEAVTGVAACQTGTGSENGSGRTQAAGRVVEGRGSTMGGASGSLPPKESEWPPAAAIFLHVPRHASMPPQATAVFILWWISPSKLSIAICMLCLCIPPNCTVLPCLTALTGPEVVRMSGR
jgi:hypothetical protein